MAIYPARYCDILWEPTRVLEARELIKLESIIKGVDDSGNHVAFDLNAVYREGATLNLTPVVNTTGGVSYVQFTAIDVLKPMLIFAKNRWWSFISGETPSITLPSFTSTIYLNWWTKEVSSITDSSLVDFSGEPTANMGQLYLQLTTTNALVSGLGYTPVEQNSVPALVFSFNSTGSAAVLAPTNSSTGVNINVNPQALSTSSRAGMVYLTDSTMSNVGQPGVACASNDPRLSAGIGGHSIVDASVSPALLSAWTVTALPLTEGFSYTGLDFDNTGGGINSSKIIYTAGLPSSTSTVATLDVLLANHLNKPLGSLNTHPTIIPSDTATFGVTHQTTDGSGDAFLVTSNSGSARLAAITHTGDVYSILAAAESPVISRSGPYSSGTLDTYGCEGTLAGTAITPSTLSILAGLVSAHINQNTHSNPHGLTLGDVGGFNGTLSSTGNIQIPIGSNTFVLQWGQLPRVAGGTTSSSITFLSLGGISFAHSCFGVFLGNTTQSGDHSSLSEIVEGTVTATEFTWTAGAGGTIGGWAQPYWFAIGY